MNAPSTARYSQCENTTAGPHTPAHLRPLTPGEELHLGGGLHDQALCGNPVNGWDTGVTHDTADDVRAFASSITGSVGLVCAACIATLP